MLLATTILGAYVTCRRELIWGKRVPDFSPPLGADESADDNYYREIQELLERHYLGAETPQGQSGFGGDAVRWERARRVITAAMDRDGPFLDIGCANGLLMESVTAWCAERGLTVEPYGLDISESLVALARRRLPEWADRLYVGNAIDWEPPMRFDYVRTELDYVPPARRQAYVERLLREVVTTGGRLIVCAYGSSREGRPRAELVGDQLRGWGFQVAGEAEVAELNGVVVTRVGWIDAGG